MLNKRATVPKERKINITYHEIKLIRLNLFTTEFARTSNHFTAGDELDDNSDLIFQLKDADDREFITQLSEYVLPIFNGIRIMNPSEDLPLVARFLRN